MTKERKKTMRIMSLQTENINEEIRVIKKKPTEILELKNIVNEMKNSPKGINSCFEQAEKRISKCEDRSIEIIQSEKLKRKRMKINEQNLKDLQDTISHSSMCIMEILGGEVGEKGREGPFEETMAINFPHLV